MLMLVYKETTSKVTRRAPSGMGGRFWMFLMKSVVFSIKDGRSLTKGCRMWSTSPEILSVGQRLALTMGRPGGGLVG